MCIHERPKKFRRGKALTPPPPYGQKSLPHGEKSSNIILPHGEN